MKKSVITMLAVAALGAAAPVFADLTTGYEKEIVVEEGKLVEKPINSKGEDPNKATTPVVEEPVKNVNKVTVPNSAETKPSVDVFGGDVTYDVTDPVASSNGTPAPGGGVYGSVKGKQLKAVKVPADEHFDGEHYDNKLVEVEIPVIFFDNNIYAVNPDGTRGNLLYIPGVDFTLPKLAGASSDKKASDKKASNKVAAAKTATGSKTLPKTSAAK